jgi:hypothetical protein
LPTDDLLLPTDDLRPIWLVLAGHIETASTIHAIIKHSVTTMLLFDACAAVNFVAALARFSSEVVFHERNGIPHTLVPTRSGYPCLQIAALLFQRMPSADVFDLDQ